MRKSSIARGLLLLFFAAQLATPFAIRRWQGAGAGPGVSRAAGTDAAALARHGFRLEEVSKQAGIDFTHRAPRLDPKLEHIMPQVASMGAAVSVADFDRDGWQDLYVTNSGEGSFNALYRNLGDGTFRDVAGEAGLADLNRKETG